MKKTQTKKQTATATRKASKSSATARARPATTSEKVAPVTENAFLGNMIVSAFQKAAKDEADRLMNCAFSAASAASMLMQEGTATEKELEYWSDLSSQHATAAGGFRSFAESIGKNWPPFLQPAARAIRKPFERIENAPSRFRQVAPSPEEELQRELDAARQEAEECRANAREAARLAVAFNPDSGEAGSAILRELSTGPDADAWGEYADLSRGLLERAVAALEEYRKDPATSRTFAQRSREYEAQAAAADARAEKARDRLFALRQMQQAADTAAAMREHTAALHEGVRPAPSSSKQDVERRDRLADAVEELTRKNAKTSRKRSEAGRKGGRRGRGMNPDVETALRRMRERVKMGSSRRVAARYAIAQAKKHSETLVQLNGEPFKDPEATLLRYYSKRYPASAKK